MLARRSGASTGAGGADHKPLVVDLLVGGHVDPSQVRVRGPHGNLPTGGGSRQPHGPVHCLHINLSLLKTSPRTPNRAAMN